MGQVAAVLDTSCAALACVLACVYEWIWYVLHVHGRPALTSQATSRCCDGGLHAWPCLSAGVLFARPRSHEDEVNEMKGCSGMRPIGLAVLRRVCDAFA